MNTLVSESAIVNSILKYLNSVPGCVADKVEGTAKKSGKPDINGCLNGKSIRIEVTTPDTDWQVTPQQMANLQKWSECGALCMVAYSLKFVKTIILPEGRICLNTLTMKERNRCLSEVVLSYNGRKL